MKKEIETLLPVGSDALVLPLREFTPGPWKWGGTQGKPGSYCYLHGADYAQVGVAFNGFTDNKADADLIAAAPKMFAVLQKLAAWDKRWPKWSDTNGTSEKELNAICEEAHAIIAEASGQNAGQDAAASKGHPSEIDG